MIKSVSKFQKTGANADLPQATYQDVLNAPRHKVAEIIDGVLYTTPRPEVRHALAGSRLGSRISMSFDFGEGGPGGWWILNEPELHFGEDIVVPDIAGWRCERMREVPDTAYLTLAPDWVCEVLSPLTRKIDVGRKREIYARENVGYLWLVDPDVPSLEAFELCGTQWMLIDTLFGDAPVSLPPFEQISFDLGDLWLPRAVHKGMPSESTV